MRGIVTYWSFPYYGIIPNHAFLDKWAPIAFSKSGILPVPYQSPLRTLFDIVVPLLRIPRRFRFLSTLKPGANAPLTVLEGSPMAIPHARGHHCRR